MARINKNLSKGLLVYSFAGLVIFWLLLASPGGGGGVAYAGQLLFDGVPVDITTAANEDLVIAPGTGGNTQIGDASGTNSHATSNDDLHLTGILETDGAAYFDSGVTLGDSTSDTITVTGYLGSHFIPATDSTYDFGSSSLAWRYLYVDIISGYNAALALNPASGYSLTGSVTKRAATGNEVAYDLAATINKSTAGNYTGLKLNMTETSAPGADDRLLDLQVAATSMFRVDNAGNVTAAGTISGAAFDLTGTTSTTFTIDQNTPGLGNPATLTLKGAAAGYGKIATTNGKLLLDAASDTLQIDDTTLDLSTQNVAVTLKATAVNDGINFDSNTFVIDANQNRVGIGTATPLAELDVNGDVLIHDGKSFAVVNNLGAADYNHSILLDQSNNVMNFKEWTTFKWTNTSPLADVEIMTLTPTTGLSVLNDDASNSTVTDILTIKHSSTAAPAAGIGTGLSFQVEDAGGLEEQASIDTVLTTVTEGAENADMVFSVNQAGAIGELMRLDAANDRVNVSGDLNITGAFTPATIGAFTAAGTIDMNTNIITNIGNAGTDFIAATGALNLADDLTLAAGADLTMSSGAGLYSQTYTGTATPMTLTANSMTTGSGISITANGLTSGSGINISSTSTAADAYKLINLSSSGANAAAGKYRYGVYSSMTGTGATSTNIAGYFSASGGTTANYSIYATGDPTGDVANIYSENTGDNGTAGSFVCTATGVGSGAKGIYVRNDGRDDVAAHIETNNANATAQTLYVTSNSTQAQDMASFVSNVTGAGNALVVVNEESTSDARGMYLRNDGDSAVAVHMENANTANNAQTLYCVHDGTGYSASFIRDLAASSNGTLTAAEVKHTVTGAAGADGIGAALIFTNETATGGTEHAAGRISGILSTAAAATSKGDLVFESAAANALTEYMRIYSAGNVRVGNTGTPTSATGAGDLYVNSDLEVDGTIYGTVSGGSAITGTTSTDFAIGSGTDAAANDITLTFGGTNPKVITWDGNGNDRFSFNQDVEFKTGGTNGRVYIENWTEFSTGVGIYTTDGGTFNIGGGGEANTVVIGGSNNDTISIDSTLWDVSSAGAFSTAANQALAISVTDQGANTNAGVGISVSADDGGTGTTGGAGGSATVTAGDGKGTGGNAGGSITLAAGEKANAGALGTLNLNNLLSIVVEGDTADTFETTLSFAEPTADRTITFPDADVNLGTISTNSHVQNTDTGTTATTFEIDNDAVAGLILDATGLATSDKTFTFPNVTSKVLTNNMSDAAVAVTLNNAADALNFDSNTLSIDALNNRVGINDTSPDAALDIDSAAAATVDSFGIIHTSTTDGADAEQIAITQSAGTLATATNAGINISATSSSITASTLLGINIGNITAGTATENAIRIGTGWDSNIVITEDAASKTKIDLSSSATNAKWIAIDSGWALSFVNDGGFKFYNSSGKAFGTQLVDIQTDGDLKVTKDVLLNDDGYIGIDTDVVNHGIKFDSSANSIQFYEYGTFEWYYTTPATDVNTMTLSGTAGLTVKNDDANASATSDILTLTHTTTGVAAAGIGTGLTFDVEGADGSEEQGSIDVILDDVSTGAEDSTMTFGIRTNGGLILEAMRIDGTANCVGIGTGGDPAAKLEVNAGSTDGIGVQIDQDDVDQTALDIDPANTSGDIINLDWAGATTQVGALTALDLDFTNLTSVAGSTTYGIHINDLGTQTSSTEYAIYQEGTNWDYGAYFTDDVWVNADLKVNSWLKLYSYVNFEGDNMVLGRYQSGTVNIGNTRSEDGGITVNLGRSSVAATGDTFNLNIANCTYNFGTLSATGDITLDPTGNDVFPGSDSTDNLGSTTVRWANLWADLINGADYSYENNWRTLEAEKYKGYPEGIAIGNEGFSDGIVTEIMPEHIKPVFVVTEDFIEYKGRKITPEILDKLLMLVDKLGSD